MITQRRLLLILLFYEILGLFVPQCAAVLLNKDEQDYCVAYNNNLRRKLANGNQQNKVGMLPPAANMLAMAYNATLGQTAQAWADQCKFAHSNASGLGENIHYSTKDDISNTEALNKAYGDWWNEATTNGIPENLVIDANNFEPIGHFTQMAWHSTTAIGCGVSKCNGDQWKLFVVCNYLPPGNVLGQPVYESGAMCGACDPGWACDNGRPGLCVRTR